MEHIMKNVSKSLKYLHSVEVARATRVNSLLHISKLSFIHLRYVLGDTHKKNCLIFYSTMLMLHDIIY